MTFDTRERSRYGGQPIECIRFDMGGVSWFFTQADKTITIAAGTFVPEPISRSEPNYDQDDNSGELQIRVPVVNPVAQLFIAFLPPAPVKVRIFRLHRGDGEVLEWWSGEIAAVSFENSGAILSCIPGGESKRRVPALTFQSTCNWALYSVQCGVLKALFTDVVSVGSVSGADVVSADFALRPDGWFTNGWLERADGDVRFVVAHVGDTVTLLAPFPALAPGAVISAIAGCDRTEPTCAAKFNNLVNHLGFARVPNRNPHEGSLT